jgi:hypothetical protein
MQIVIDVPQKLVYEGFERPFTEKEKNVLIKSIGNGTPLQKGHGRLIDADAFIETMEDASKRNKYKELLFDDYLTVDDVFKAVIESLQNRGLAEGDAPTIIEADKSEREEKE